MTSLDQREHALETEFAHRQDLNFQARERAVKALAKWAAERLGKVGEAVEAYGDEIVGSTSRTRPWKGRSSALPRLSLQQESARSKYVGTMDQFMATAAATVRSTVQSPR